MRGALALTFVLIAAAALAGCSGSGDETSSTDNVATKGSSTGTKSTVTRTTTVTTTSTSKAPNVPARLVLKVTADGNATNVTTVGGNLTFDASGSTDPDGPFSAIAISVQDANRTFPTQTLYANGQFTPVTFKFDRAGPVNVSVNALEGSGELAQLSTHAYVDSTQRVGTLELRVPLGGLPNADPKTCEGPSGGSAPALDNTVYTTIPFTVGNGASFVVATSVGSDALFAICDFNGAPISEASEDVATSTNTAPLPPPVGAVSYYLSVYGTSPSGGIPQFDVVVHYEPRAAA